MASPRTIAPRPPLPGAGAGTSPDAPGRLPPVENSRDPKEPQRPGGGGRPIDSTAEPPPPAPGPPRGAPPHPPPTPPGFRPGLDPPLPGPSAPDSPQIGLPSVSPDPLPRGAPPHPQTHSLKFGEIPESYGNHVWQMALYIRPSFSPGLLFLPLILCFQATSLGRNPALLPPLQVVFISLLFANVRGFLFLGCFSLLLYSAVANRRGLRCRFMKTSLNSVCDKRRYLFFSAYLLPRVFRFLCYLPKSLLCWLFLNHGDLNLSFLSLTLIPR